MRQIDYILWGMVAAGAMTVPFGVVAAAVPATSKPIAVDTTTSIDKQDIRAQLSPLHFTTLAAEVGAKIEQIEVQEGERFKAGQMLIRFDCSLQAAQLQKAQAALGAAEKSFAANKRLAELHSVGQLDLDLSEAEAAKAQADVSLINATLNKCKVAAPFSGRVAEQKVREQQFVQPGQPILDILDDSVLELEFIVPSRWLMWLKNGYRFQVQIDETATTYPARITRVGARVDPVSQSLKVAATINGRFPELMAGMSGRVHLLPPTAGEVGR